MSIPRPEHPKPQFQRVSWFNLNGQWTYEFDPGKSGMDAGRNLHESTGFGDEITVPFCPESVLSGVAHTDFIEAMWYHRSIEIPADWDGSRVLLHFGGVDYECEAFIDGVSVGTHFGGTVSFCFDITSCVSSGATHSLVVRVLDELRTAGQPRGKQCRQHKSCGCSYTRTTGIWQTVWLEAMAPTALKDCQIIPDFDGDAFVFVPSFHAVESEQRLRISVLANGKTAGVATVAAADGVPVRVALDEVRHWSPASPFLYDVRYETLDGSGAVTDVVQSYAGLRKVQIRGDRVYLNNEPLYFRFVLDQGFYPDGIWTAPTDTALRRDIELSMTAGFNGARLHQKVFEERFHYWADQLGYLTWGESASWGCNVNRLEDARNFLSEWREIVIRDRNKPSIIAWTPFNETRMASNPPQHHRLHIDAYELSKALDPTRPVNDTSGYIHVRTDLWTVHHYERADKLGVFLQPAESADGVFHRWPELESSYQGQPYINDEFGGLKWIPEDRRAFADNTWGYGNDLESIEQFYELLEAEIEVMLAVPNLSGWCYTQLTDIEQEQNGVYNYDRTEKFDLERLAALFRREP